MAFRVALVGGGSGGHVYPLVAVARALQQEAAARSLDLQMRLIGDGPFLAVAAKEAGLPYRRVFSPKLRRYASIANVFDIFKIPIAIVQSIWHLFWFMPDVVFAKGGYASAFPALIARLFFIPVYIHESDSVPGLANVRIGSFARGIFTAFSGAAAAFAPRPVLLVGNPVRPELFSGDRAAARAGFGIPADAPVVAVLGGSQGAQQLNNLLLGSLGQLLAAGYVVIHQCGTAHEAATRKEIEVLAKEPGGERIATQYKLLPFLDLAGMANVYAAADVVITRAGAGSLTEVALAGKPAVVIPLEGSAGDHQLLNAAEFAKFGASVIQGKNATPSILIHEIQRQLDAATYVQRAERIRQFARPDAASAIARTLLDL